MRFEVVTADNGKHALERINERKPDLISLDLVMPKIRGVSICRKIPNRLPFTVVTAHARDELGREDFLKLKADKLTVGPNSFIEKPVIPSEYINPDNFISKVKEVLK
jgi:CheY-like chemotaxis protein